MISINAYIKLSGRILILVSIICLACNSAKDKSIDHPSVLAHLIDSAGKLVDQKKEKNAFEYLDSSLYNINDLGVDDRWKVLSFKHTFYIEKGRRDNDLILSKKALNYADSMLFLLDTKTLQGKYPLQFCLSNFAKGDALFDLKNFQQSYQYFYNGKLIADQKLDRCQQANFNSRFALLNFKQGKDRMATTLFMQAYRDNLYCKQDFNNYAATQGALSNAGLSYIRLEKPDSAMICYKMALNYLAENAKKFPNKMRFTYDAQGVIYHNLANLINDNNYPLAVAYLKKSVSLNEKNGNEQRNAQVAKLRLARLYLDIGNPELSLVLLKQLRKGIDTLSSQRSEVDWQQLMYDYHIRINQKVKAQPYLKEYLKLKAEGQKVETKVNEVSAGEEFYNLKKEYELNLLTRDNQLRNSYLIFTISLFLMSVLLIIVLLRNVKTTKKNNQALNAINKQMIEQNEYLHQTLQSLEESQEENNRVMQIITHDLRSPMAAIVGLSGFMIDEHNLSETDLEVISLINTSGIDSLKFINEILDRESSTTTLKTEMVDLNQLLNYCTTQLQYKAKDKNQTISLESASVTLMLNREKIWRVISNLINNAIKFSQSDAIIEVCLKVKAAKAIISVKDHGIGIPEHLKDKIFAATDESKREGTSGEKSFGLGLSICKHIIEDHGGKIWFESLPNSGTTFFVELPIT